jgi:hypothetical protein
VAAGGLGIDGRRAKQRKEQEEGGNVKKLRGLHCGGIIALIGTLRRESGGGSQAQRESRRRAAKQRKWWRRGMEGETDMWGQPVSDSDKKKREEKGRWAAAGEDTGPVGRPG